MLFFQCIVSRSFGGASPDFVIILALCVWGGKWNGETDEVHQVSVARKHS